MKHRAADRLPWPCVTARRFTVQAFATAEFHGVVTLLCMNAIREPLWIEGQGQRFCICDKAVSVRYQKRGLSPTWLDADPSVALAIINSYVNTIIHKV